MVKQFLITTLLAFNAIIVFPTMGQSLTDREAIIQILADKNIDGKFIWRPSDSQLKKLAIEIITKQDTEISVKGLCRIITVLTKEEYDDNNDSIFLNTLISKIDPNQFINTCGMIGNHFNLRLYNTISLKKLKTLTQADEVLKWQSWTPYYLCYLGFTEVEASIIFLKKNITAVNQLHYSLNKEYHRFDTLDLNICLSRLGKYSDSLVIQQIDQQSRAGYSRDYIGFIKSMAKVRTMQSFQKIGELLISDLYEIHFEERKFIKQTALAAFLVYVKNFPDRSLKIQETINQWTFVQFSKAEGKDYDTDEYMENAKKWYIENKENLLLDMDKY
ncbi:MAG: hypothetical protein IPN73_08580 [Saprospiraceae bacterium]|nr:hypothetical protein [Saprospiraceae bacterium]MBK8850199.1 hypothetical protein [Saprospiraceae bacterium]